MNPFNNFFGSEIFKKSQKKDSGPLETFDVENEPGTESILESAGGILAYDYSSLKIPEDEAQLILTYRKLALSPEVDLALGEIFNESFIFDVPDKKAVNIDFVSGNDISKNLADKIREEYDTIYELLDFKNQGIELFSDFYIDGRIHFHKIIDSKSPKRGIQKVVKIDSLKIKKIREYPNPDSDGLYDLSKIKEFYVYVDRPDVEANRITASHFSRGMKIVPDAIAYTDSGVYDRTKNRVLSHLWKVITPYNNLRLLEDSAVIYRVTRAPERRVFYVDVGNLPKNKAEQYVKDLMGKFKNKLVYDNQTGSVVDRKNVMSMIEDFWLPRRDGKGTEVSTLPAGAQLGEITDLEYFRTKLYQALNVPMSRFSEQSPAFMFGKGVEIYREEYRFKKFIDKIRNRFCYIFEDLLKTQLILKNIITDQDWKDIKNSIQWVFAEDNSFVEFKESEVISNRLQLLQQVESYVGTYYTKDWVMRNVLRFTEEETDRMKKDLKKENPPSDSDDDDDEEFEPLAKNKLGGELYD